MLRISISISSTY